MPVHAIYNRETLSRIIRLRGRPAGDKEDIKTTGDRIDSNEKTFSGFGEGMQSNTNKDMPASFPRSPDGKTHDERFPD